jgi:glycosyltransferase involved in cell wall biosynthesis
MITLTHDRGVKAAGKPADTSTIGQTLHVVCLSPQSWRVALPTNRQQVMRRVVQAGHSVLYVETGAFVGRRLVGFFRRSDSRSPAREHSGADLVAPGLQVMTAPTLVPWGHRSRVAARVNAFLTSWILRRRLRGSAQPIVLWLYDPCFAFCIGTSGERLAVYDCVDDYAEQVGADDRKRAFVSACDALAASRADLVFTTSKSLASRHRDHNPHTHIVGNVGDYSHFAPAAERSFAVAELASLRRPTIGFAGNFLPEKVDFSLLETIAVRRPDWTIVLVGPVRDRVRPAVDRLASHGNVHLVGPVPYEDLPRYVASFDVATIPYLRNAYTQSCFPLKTFEYLAAGRPVVASGLPELEGMEPHVVLADDADTFIAAIDRALTQTSISEVVARQQLAASNTWESRTQRMLELVASEL